MARNASVLFLDMAPTFERSLFCVSCVMCLNSTCDLNCDCPFRMLFPCVFLCLCIFSYSSVSSFAPFVSTRRISMLLLMSVDMLMLLKVCFDEMVYKVDSVAFLLCLAFQFLFLTIVARYPCYHYSVN